jgi:hydrogenase maturation protein HypF
MSADLPPDLATCEACRRELFDAADRRYRYPFVNCTDCGPRATIVDDLPYDRVRTVMRRFPLFPLCPRCAAEYADPADRRFHAEPVACPECGPRLSWSDGLATGEAALLAAVETVRRGGIVAVRGLGGYQLVCDGTAPAAVTALRERKHRPAKPFAVMVADMAAARVLAWVDTAEAALLAGSARPIVLLAARVGGTALLAPGVHPGTGEVGLFLPTTPLHHLLLAELARPLVVTSGNRSDEPIAVEDAEAQPMRRSRSYRR